MISNSSTIEVPNSERFDSTFRLFYSTIYKDIYKRTGLSPKLILYCVPYEY